MPGYFDRAFDQIERGLSGENEGIPIPYPNLKQHLPNIQRSTYYLLGANSKVGKTSISDELFMYGPYDHYKTLQKNGMLGDFMLDIDYFSFEIDLVSKIIKGIGRKLWYDYGIIADANTILSRGKNHCSDELYTLIRNYREYFNEMEDIVNIEEMKLHPTAIYHQLKDKAHANGEVINKVVATTDKGKDIQRFDRYEPKHKNRYWLAIVDHVALMMEEQGFNTKKNIDTMSSYFVELRNHFGLSPVVIQQLAGSAESQDKGGLVRQPDLTSFGDSKYTIRDANVIMALFSPYRHQIPEYKGYDVTQLRDTYRNLEIIVNRDGAPNINVGMNFIGPCGAFRELPSAQSMADSHYKYASSMRNGKSKFVRDATGTYMLRKGVKDSELRT